MIIWLLNFYAIRIYVHLDGANGCWYSCIEWTNICLQLKYPNSIRDCAFYRYLFFFGTDDCCFAFNIHWIYQSINHSRATTKPPSNIHLDELLAAVAVGRLMAINRKRPASSWTCPEANGNIRSVRVPTSNCNIDYSKCGHGFVVELANYRHSRASLSKVANVSMN